MHDEPTQEDQQAWPAVVEPVELATPVIKRGRGRPPKDAGAALLPEKPKLPRGRQAGYRVPTFADLDELTVEDFSFVRGVVNGMSPHDAYARFYGNIHFDSQGAPLVPHGATLRATFDALEQRILATAQASEDERMQHAASVIAVKIPDEAAEADKRDINEIFNEWFESLPSADYYREDELPERFQDHLQESGIKVRAAMTTEVSRAVIIDRKVKAINELQTALAYRPRPNSVTSIWLAGTLTNALSRLQITTLEQLVRFIERTGRHWHRKVPRLGPVRAARLQAWLTDHADTLGRIQTSGPRWLPHAPLRNTLLPLDRAQQASLELVPPPAGPSNLSLIHSNAFAIAPLELLQVPPRLDGQEGLFRVRGPNFYEARTDIDAITVWLRSFLLADKKRTLETYRREAERFLIWCYSEAQVAMSSVSIGHAQAYQGFLKKIPDAFICKENVTRTDPRWKPWRGQLSAKSQTYALTVIKLMYQSLFDNAYITGNPFSSLKSAAAIDRSMDTSRSLDKGDLQWLREQLDERMKTAFGGTEELPPDGDGEVPCPTLMQARTRRINLIVEMLVRTGIRLEEAATRTLANKIPALVDGQAAPGEFVLEVIGKGKKVRTVYLAPIVWAMVDAHHHDVEQLILTAEGPHSPRLRAFRAERPLIASLTGISANTSNSPTKSGNLSIALGRQGIYKTLKSFLSTAAKRDLTGLKAKYKKVKAKLERATKSGDGKEVALLKTEIRRLDVEASIAKRRMRFSTHWMRHTYAKEVLRTNPDGTGLVLAKNTLGHASLATTGAYLRQDMSSMVKALRKINPLGS